MTLAFLIYHYFPHGGQQRDFMRIAQRCCEAGYKVRVYSLVWEGEVPEAFELHIVPVKAMSRHALYKKYRSWVCAALKRYPVDCVVGFSKMPGLDVYFAADPCFAERMHRESRPWLKWLPRYRHFLKYERSVFSDDGAEVLLLSPQQQQDFLRHYPRAAERLHVLPPGLSADRFPGDDAVQRRQKFRERMGLSDQDLAVLQVGSGFRIKGVDRSLQAIAALPDDLRARVTFFVVGDDRPGRFQQLAIELNLLDQVSFLGGRDDVPDFLLGCDLMLHPAYQESAGYALLEGIINGLPVLTTDTCGYAFHVEQAGAGQVCASPFSQEELNERLANMLASEQRSQWAANGRAYAAQAGEAGKVDLTGLADQALQIISQVVDSKGSPGWMEHRETL